MHFITKLVSSVDNLCHLLEKKKMVDGVATKKRIFPTEALLLLMG